MQKKTFCTRGLVRLLAATVLILFSGCSNDSDRRVVDFSEKKDLRWPAKPLRDGALNVAVASMVSPIETFVHYQALLEYLAARVRMRVNFIQRKTYAEINDLLGSGGIDLAFICSGPYVSGRHSHHFEALAVPLVSSKPVYRAYLIASRTGPVHKLEDLRGKVFAFSDPDSNTGCIVPRFLLAERGEVPQSFFGKTMFTYSHDNSILAVSRALVDGAFVHEHIWEYFKRKSPAATAGTRVIFESEPFGNPPLVASASMPGPLKNRIRELLFSMHRDAEGAAILEELLIDRFMPPDEHLYDPIRRMHARLSSLEDGHDAVSQP